MPFTDRDRTAGSGLAGGRFLTAAANGSRAAADILDGGPDTARAGGPEALHGTAGASGGIILGRGATWTGGEVGMPSGGHGDRAGGGAGAAAATIGGPAGGAGTPRVRAGAGTDAVPTNAGAPSVSSRSSGAGCSSAASRGSVG